MNLGDNAIIQDIEIHDQPTGYNYNAPLPDGFTNIRTRLYWEQQEPLLLGDGSSRPRSRRVAIIGGDRLPPPSIERGRVLFSVRHLAHLRQNDRQHYQQMPGLNKHYPSATLPRSWSS
eukprot:9472012-Pyramimonas_sp.AAC.1